MIGKVDKIACDICKNKTFICWKDKAFIYFSCEKCGADQARIGYWEEQDEKDLEIEERKQKGLW